MMRHIVLAATLLMAGPALAQASTMQVQNAWARATAPSAKVGGVFLTLIDSGGPDRLVSVASPVAATAELHETVNDQGIMKMRAVPVLPLEAGKPVELKPGSYHIMLMDLKRQLKPGDSFPITLTFEKAAPVTATVTVGKAGASGPEAMDHDMQHMQHMTKP
ncbi:copper chaperone PCu(A)C [Limobrevibacterium gyesilva]|uniref:Copper chaperone PCu(A)C n=1 Tax=Limobrevibacterium gyesilva TaxID=2991712 RepID=A0AA41YNM1_9PROT|nr:copper chaperone PCu(A)C [Limobrevibacterium gyesilva]MCW3473635.1 copper chaperone PCu(A)C [Limobrevibacterium gyesilva]